MRAQCFVCNKKIAAGEWRMDYRKNFANSFCDQVRIHAACAGNVPAETREVDRRYVRHAFAVTADLESREMLKRVAFDLGFEL